MTPKSFKEEMDAAVEDFVADVRKAETGTNGNKAGNRKIGFKVGAQAALTSTVVKDMAIALNSVLATPKNNFNDVEQDICRDALANYNRAVKGE